MVVFAGVGPDCVIVFCWLVGACGDGWDTYRDGWTYVYGAYEATRGQSSGSMFSDGLVRA